MAVAPWPGQVTETQAPVTSNDGATTTTSTNLLPVKEVVSLGLGPEQGAGASMVPSDQPGGDRLVPVPRRRDLVPSAAVPTTTRSGQVVRKPERYKDFVKI